MKQLLFIFDTVLTVIVFAVIAYGIYAIVAALSVGIIGVTS